MLDPYERSLAYELRVDVQLQHSSLNTTKLRPEESASSILSSIVLRDPKS